MVTFIILSLAWYLIYFWGSFTSVYLALLTVLNLPLACTLDCPIYTWLDLWTVKKPPRLKPLAVTTLAYIPMSDAYSSSVKECCLPAVGEYELASSSRSSWLLLIRPTKYLCVKTRLKPLLYFKINFVQVYFNQNLFDKHY